MPNKSQENSDNVKVVVRCRPMNEKEKGSNFHQIVKIDEVRGQVIVEGRNANEVEKTFTFDTVFSTDSKQVDVYNLTARPIVDSVLSGYNGTIFAYGQTGTGKTFTMEGVRSVPELRGIIPNSFAHVFGHIAKAEGDSRFLVRVSYLEIYNEEVRDLLGKDQKKRLHLKERPDVGVYVKDLSTFVVNNADDMDRIMTIGHKNRSVGATDMNEQSSRSHAIFTITIECSEKGIDQQQHVKVGKLHLVDLAGSERQQKSGATGLRLKEATKINLSLSTLGNVISALVDGRSTHIPYRNSKLTRMLQDSLGGNSKTLMCANFGPANYNYDETISTLRYANRAKNIKNKAVINEDPKDALLRQFQKEIEELKKKLAEEGGEASEDSEESEEEFVDENGKNMRRKKRKRRLSPGRMAAMEKQIEEEKKKLEDDRNMAEEEKNRVKTDLKKRTEQLQKAQKEQQQLQVRLQNIERKVIVGGVDLLQKAEDQEKLLEESNTELQLRKTQQEDLRKQIEDKEAEKLDIEEKYENLKDEALGKTRKLKKVYTMLMTARSELEDTKREHDRDVDALISHIKQVSRDVKKLAIMCEYFVPQHCMEMVQQNMQWNEHIGEWQLKGIAYTGNNMRKPTPRKDATELNGTELDLSNHYLSYTSDGLADPMTSSANGKNKPRLRYGRKKKQKSAQQQIDAVLLG